MRWRRSISAVVLFVLFVGGGCAPSRALPAQPSLRELQALDLCALAPTALLRMQAADLPAGTKRIMLGPGQCTFSVPGVDVYLAIGPSQDHLPSQLKRAAEDDAAVEGGVVVHTGQWPGCGGYLVSDHGYVLSTNYYVSRVARGAGICDYPDLYVRTVLRDLADGAPTAVWPEDALAWRNVCAEVDQAEFARFVVTERADARRCTVYLEKNQPFPSLLVELTARLELPTQHPESVAVAGYPAQLKTAGECRLRVRMGSNAELRRRAGPDAAESLDFAGTVSPGHGCEELVGVVEPFVQQFGR